MIIDGFTHQLPDTDPGETEEWLDALDSVIAYSGQTRARFLMARLIARAREQNVVEGGGLAPDSGAPR